ncbi:MAG: carbohydrate-binding domain-containing protein [Bacilli bacterium]|nr:carbohydrate-binding domain-containing protein [Bacilli bacterium]
MKKHIGGIVTLVILIVLTVVISIVYINKYNSISTLKVNLTNLTYEVDDSVIELKKYTQDEFDAFVKDYNEGNLPSIYVTEFIFDGVAMVKPYDLDDFLEEGNDYEYDALEITTINVNTIGNIEFTGEIVGGMIAVNTNDIKGNINLVLNGVNIDTDSKKVPAIYVYNKDINYTDHKVTIKTVEGTQNYIEGGKLKKTSLVANEELSNYTNNYSGDNKTNYETYTNYYGVYTSSEINNILFAKIEADKEDLQDGDPYYFYKASGAISSDIDLYFEGEGYLSVISKNKEGIETKGNLTFSGGTGDYYINAEDDCLNTTTDGDNYRNSLTIDVNKLVAIVDLDADEGDAIDSNGTLTINGGIVIALSKPGQDAGLDSSKGTYVNGGTILATGDMYDEISSDSKQNFIVLSMGERISEDTLITLLDDTENVIFSYLTDRTYTNLIYSSSSLKEGTYSLYKGGSVTGTNEYGLYRTITNYQKGTMLGYTNTGVGMQGGPMGDNQGNQMTPPSDMGERPSMPEGEAPSDMGERPSMPEGEAPSNMGERPSMPEGEVPSNMGERPSMPEGENSSNMGNAPTDMQGTNNITSATNKEFIVSGIVNIFSGVATYSE